MQALRSVLGHPYRRCRELFHRFMGNYPHLPVAPHAQSLRRLGTDYGGWTFVDSTDLHGSTILSCGLGEDASFDVEFAAQYGARVILVDPTPRAVVHYEALKSRIGQGRERQYAGDGREPIDAYDLTTVSAEQLVMVERALWNDSGKLRFFTPPNPTHVSHSVINFQNKYLTVGDYIEVLAITLDEVMSNLGISDVSLIKLDIEGAEIEVVADMLRKGIRPKQLLLEYDELLAPSKKSRERIEGAHRGLLSAGYLLIHKEATNFTYLLR